MVSPDGSGSSDDDDYAMHQPGLEPRARYPLHDCCEFEDAEILRVSSCIPCINVLVPRAAAVDRKALFWLPPTEPHLPTFAVLHGGPSVC